MLPDNHKFPWYGIPFVSFVVKEGEGAVFIEPRPLFDADSLLMVQEAAAPPAGWKSVSAMKGTPHFLW